MDKVTRMKRPDSPMILQEELKLLRNSSQKRRELMRLEQRLSQRIMQLLEAGGSVEAGQYRACVRVSHVSTRRIHRLIVK